MGCVRVHGAEEGIEIRQIGRGSGVVEAGHLMDCTAYVLPDNLIAIVIESDADLI